MDENAPGRTEGPTATHLTVPATETNPNAAHAAEPVGDRVGDYVILSRLGGGGMGVVYEARDTVLKRVVALKKLRPEASEDMAARFVVEAEAIARLVHPNIIPILDHGRPGEVPFYTMPRAARSLASRMEVYQADTRAAVALMEKVARAVMHAHDHHVLHRDLKPGNILLDAAGEPLVADFGLAKLLDAETDLTSTGALLGTPSYMAPEQAAGRLDRLGSWTDVWALGVILYELTAGRRPFPGRTREELTPQILASEPPRPRSLRPGIVDRRLESVILACLRKEPERRYPSAGALADDLGRWLRGSPVLGVAESLPAKITRLARRYGKAAAGLLSVIGIVVILAVALRPEPPENVPASESQAQRREREREAIGRELAAGRAVELLGESGLPRSEEWITGEAKLFELLNETERGCSFHTYAYTLLELLRDPPCECFIISAEVRQDDSSNGMVGLYVGRTQLETVKGTLQRIYSFTFADKGGRVAGQGPNGPRGFALGGVRCVVGTGPTEEVFGESVSTTEFVPAGTARQSDWRPMAIEVTPSGVTPVWAGARLPEISRAELARTTTAIKLARPWLNGLEVDLNPCRGGIGLYATHGVGSFRRVRIVPKDAR